MVSQDEIVKNIEAAGNGLEKALYIEKLRHQFEHVRNKEGKARRKKEEYFSKRRKKK